MALVQSLPVSVDHPAPGLDPHLHRRSPTSPPSRRAMGPVSSHRDRGHLEASTKFGKGTPGSGRLLTEVGSRTPSSKRRGIVGRGKGFGTRSYSHEDLIKDWSGGFAGVDGPPKLVPVSGQLERVSMITDDDVFLNLLEHANDVYLCFPPEHSAGHNKTHCLQTCRPQES